MFETKSGSIKIYTDGANLDSIISLSNNPLIDGITTNPTLMKKSGVTNYMNFANAAVKASKSKSISLEVFADDHNEMIRQAKILSNLGPSVYVKIPITNSFGKSSVAVIKELLQEKIKLNITAILTENQINECLEVLDKNNIVYLSIFAGRIADTGRDPKPIFKKYKKLIQNMGFNFLELLWASTREVFNVYEAIESDCDIITLTPEIIKKLDLKYYDLKKLSLETVQMFKNDSSKSNFSIDN